MNNLKELKDEEIIELIKQKKVKAADLTDSGICPTCFNREHNEVLYGDNSDKMLYEDDTLECFLVGNPRAIGHTTISTKKHFKDMMEADEETCIKVYTFARKMMQILKRIYNAESIYLCTMCDGPMNHFHVQLIPRYEKEKRGSDNFTKPRGQYVEDKIKLLELRRTIEETNK